MLLFELFIDDDKKGKEKGVTTVSIVETPAILVNFLKFAEEGKKMRFSVDEEQQFITGPALIPNVKIIRDANESIPEPYYVYFSESTIREIAELFLENENNNEVSLDHLTETSKVKLRESWIIEDESNDKAYALGFKSEDVTKGSWMVSYQVNDDELWQDIKDGELNGFSIEASLALKQVSQNFKASTADPFAPKSMLPSDPGGSPLAPAPFREAPPRRRFRGV